MPRSVKVTRYKAKNVNFQLVGAYRIAVKVTEPLGMDPYVFLMQRLPVNPHTGEQLDIFLTVCSPVDYVDYPVGAPSPTTTYPYWRANEITLDVRAVSLADQIWAVILQEIKTLINALDTLDHLSGFEEVWIGDISHPPESSSVAGP
jgi:hypothetical protein